MNKIIFYIMSMIHSFNFVISFCSVGIEIGIAHFKGEVNDYKRYQSLQSKKKVFRRKT